MGSRLKQNPEQTFYWFFEATCPVARDKDPDVLFQFPDDFSDEESFQTLPRFCFPYDIQRVRAGVAVQHFTFVLTDLEGCQRFGFCRLANSMHTCLCILSYLPWFEVFYKLLNSLADYMTKGQTNEMKALLAALYQQPVPLAAGSVTLQMGEQLLVSTGVSHPVGHPEGQEGVPYFIAPDPRSLPSIPENRNLTELIVAVDVGNLLQIYASMLFERRILIFASKLSTLTSCVHAFSTVLYPMYWQHIFIPILPPHLLDYCCAPMPYLIGVHTSLAEVRSRGLEEVVILNVDTNTLETPFDDLKRIPSDVMSGLKLCLKRQAVSPGCGVSLAFLKAQALLFGGYRDALQTHEEGEICFSEKMFLDHKSHSMRQFLQSAVHLQLFKEFIDGRLDILNKGKEPDDLFEEEILKCEATAGTSKSYQQLVGNLKKGGGALILNMKSKAHMRAKGLAKSGLKNLLLHKAHNEEHTLQRGGSVAHRRAQSDCLQDRLPITQHFGKPRPRRPLLRFRSPRDQDNMKDTGDTWDGAVSEPVVEPDSELQKDEDEGEDTLLCDPEEMDLLGEIFDTLSSRSYNDRGVLYGTRSLDLFGPDTHDYITKFGRVNPSQESLCLSISGSGSLHSWNLETTEELSDVTGDSDWPNLDIGVPEDEESESLLARCEKGENNSGQREDGEKQEEVKVVINGNPGGEKENTYTFKEVKFEEKRKKEGEEMRESLGEEPVKDKREDEGLTEKREDERNRSDEVTEGHRETDQIQKGIATEERNENQDDKEKEVTRSLNTLIKLNLHDRNTVEEQQGQQERANPESTASPGPQSLAADPQRPAGQNKSCEEAVNKSERELRQIPSTPKVLSAVERFQSQGSSQSFQVRSSTKGSDEPGRPGNVLWSKENTQTHHVLPRHSSEENDCPEVHKEEDSPLIKVSELKKRFEA
ncbi:DENN domain-containing protein 1B isoform X2 [Hippoglossus hippoglossus]|uniref:DENN domain-containing protein 1B isoform X2 n=1 Tax=Hippoglossus hippoglossus TaxID=8267 RepID=UPI00148E0836|nr:DENN domain-containing protein 1B isoform X2 [Hippoglossus hippoglossus]